MLPLALLIMINDVPVVKQDRGYYAKQAQIGAEMLVQDAKRDIGLYEPCLKRLQLKVNPSKEDIQFMKLLEDHINEQKQIIKKFEK